MKEYARRIVEVNDSASYHDFDRLGGTRSMLEAVANGYQIEPLSGPNRYFIKSKGNEIVIVDKDGNLVEPLVGYLNSGMLVIAQGKGTSYSGATLERANILILGEKYYARLKNLP